MLRSGDYFMRSKSLLPGLLIAFEGIDGAGKDTFLNAILPGFYTEGHALYLSKHQEVVRTKEPTYYTAEGKRLVDFFRGWGVVIAGKVV